MRRGLTLIELIFTMVIVAVTFTVIPKLIQTLGTANKVTMQEDAIFNTMTLMGLIIRLPWDNENRTNSQILRVNSGDPRFDCNGTTFYRPGGFVGGRLCVEQSTAEINATTTIGREGSLYNDIDDYDGESLDTLTSCGGQLYDLNVVINYENDTTFTTLAAGQTSNTKHIEITTMRDSASRYKANYDFCVVFDYFSYNIGYATIKKRLWQ